MFKNSLFLFIFSFPILALGFNESMFDFFKKFKYTLSPEIKGTLVLDQRPLKNLTVYLEANFLKNAYKRSSITNELGEFHFKPVIHSQRFKESALNQTYSYIGIYTYINEEKKYIWESQLSYVSPPIFIKDNLNNLYCELKNKEFRYFFKNINLESARDLMVISNCNLNGFLYKTEFTEDT
ncbi:hypothetical protein H4F24_12180 [Vibrio alginolyticus]|nr:hypothetical protein V12G01_04806 [Vibrio alginolyticus 12G01]EGQ7762338.1 hypothetical protein [Vibrio alginolyticus]MDK9743570.1 hypothetical protein [Vibrio sp. B516a]MDW1823627.1 DUF6795 domain-containing protein [Vibrio sp. Vb0937]NNN62842.1 hypothetical protein [Vibrio sp. 2-1(7)]USD76591.1 hypothetical protein J4N43_16310 [Vibrio sp. SCSIO 43009]